MADATEGAFPASGDQPYKKRVPKTEGEFVSYVKRFVSDCRRQRYAFEKQWLLNYAYYLGMHYYSWDSSGRRLREPQVPTYRVRLVVNYILSTVDAMIAKLLRNRPTANVRPSNDDDVNQSGAELAGQIYDTLWERNVSERTYYEVAKWAAITGTGYVHTFWDGQAGETWEEPDEAGIPQTFYVGDIGEESVSPFDLFLDPDALRPDKSMRVVRRKREPIEKVRMGWPDKAKDIKPTPGEDEGQSIDVRLANLGVRTPEGYSEHALESQEYVVVYEMWELPQALTAEERLQWPRGRVVTICGSTLLSVIHHPYKHGEIPYVAFSVNAVPARPYGLSAVDQIAQLNRGYNRALSKALEALQLMSNPQWVAPLSAAPGKNAITSEPGGIIRYADGTTPPTAVPPPPLMGSGHTEVMKMMEDAMFEASGVREVSRGSAPPGVTSGVAINLLQEQDDTRIGVNSVRPLELCIQRQGRQKLELVQQFYIEPRLMKIAGQDSSYDTIDFTGADLHGNTDLTVDPGSALPQSKVARQAQVNDWWNMGVIPHDPAGISLFYRLSGVPNIDLLFKEEQVDLNCADEENRRLTKGMPQAVLPWQDHSVHIARHNLVRKRANYASLPPDIQNLFNQHVSAHEQAQAMMAGAGGGGPQPQPGIPPGSPPGMIGAAPHGAGPPPAVR